MAGAYGTQREKRNVCMILGDNPQGKRSFGRRKFRWEYNIKN
jgi:hypothetical protein